MKALGYIAAVVGGAVAGATAALLLAPEKGEDTRAKIQDTVREFCDKHQIQESIRNFCKKHNLKLSNEDMEELATEIS